MKKLLLIVGVALFLLWVYAENNGGPSCVHGDASNGCPGDRVEYVLDES